MRAKILAEIAEYDKLSGKAIENGDIELLEEYEELIEDLLEQLDNLEEPK